MTLWAASKAVLPGKLIEIFAQKKWERQLQIQSWGLKLGASKKEHIKKGKAKTN